MVKWNEAFHIYVAMVAEETPNEIGNLTLYAQTIQRIANSCRDHTARLFVGNFGVEGNETLTPVHGIYKMWNCTKNQRC